MMFAGEMGQTVSVYVMVESIVYLCCLCCLCCFLLVLSFLAFMSKASFKGVYQDGVSLPGHADSHVTPLL